MSRGDADGSFLAKSGQGPRPASPVEPKHDLGPETPPTRRNFLDALLGLSVVAWVGSILFPALRYLTPIAASGPGGPVKLAAEEVAKLEKERFVIVRAGASKIIVLKDGKDQIRALSAKCTHEGCTVQFVPGDSVDLVRLPQREVRPRRDGCSPVRRRARSPVTRCSATAEGSIAVTPEDGVSDAPAAQGPLRAGWIAGYELGTARRVRPAQGGAGRGHSMVWYYLGGHDALLLHRPDRLGRPAAHVLPGRRGDLVRVASATSRPRCPFGWLIRSIHCWSAHLMILSLVVAHVQRRSS